MLRLLNRNKSFVGLDIGSNALKAVELRPSRGNGVVLVGLGFEEISPDCIVDGTIFSPVPVSDTIRRILSVQPIRNGRVSTSVAGHSVIVKKISLPAQRDQDLAESIRCEAEQHIPFDIAEVNLDYQILGENTQTGHLDILLVAAKKDKIADYASVIRMAGKMPMSTITNRAPETLQRYSTSGQALRQYILFPERTSFSRAMLELGAINTQSG